MAEIRTVPNKYRTWCHYCKNTVERHEGVVWRQWGKWLGAHLDCYEKKSGRVVETYFPSTGNRVTRNVGGTCEDAPCCECCTF